MNRNSEYNLAQNPQVGVSRSRFQRNSDNKTTFNTGDLIPIYLDEVLPGDTHQIDVALESATTTTRHVTPSDATEKIGRAHV